LLSSPTLNGVADYAHGAAAQGNLRHEVFPERERRTDAGRSLGGLSRDNQNRVASDNQRHIHWWNISEAGSRLSSPQPPSAVA